MDENILYGKNIILRALEPEDLEHLYQWENDTEIWNVSETLSPISRYILKKYLLNATRDIFETRQLRLIIQLRNTDKAIGTMDIFDFDHFHKRAAVGILIADKTERKKGYAGEALEIIKKYAFTVLRLHQLYCTITVTNTSSLELFQKAGYEISGIRKEWNWRGDNFQDEYFLQLVNSES